MEGSNPPPYSAQPGNMQAPPPGAAYYQPYPPPQPGGAYQQPYVPYPYPAPPQGAAGGQATVQTQQPKPVTTTTIVINATGNCPQCRIGNLEEHFTMAGLCLAFWCFPFGIICCLSWRVKKCSHCNHVLP